MGLTRPRLGQFQTTTTAFDDEIIVLNNSATGTNTNDIGIVFERGDSTNTALIWDESADTFSLISTTEQGSTQGNVSISSYSALKVGNLTTNGITFPLSDGTNGQSIVTDGSGNLSFSSAAGVVDWETDQGATNIHANNYTNTTYSSSDFAHNSLSGVTANEHIDWTSDQGATNIHLGNYTNTTYSVGDGGLTQNNFTSTLKSKLDGIESSATADQTNAEIKVAYEANANSNEFSDAEQTKLSGIASSANNYSHPSTHSISEVSGLQTALDAKTTTSYVDTQITNLIGGAPGALNTLNELAAAINDDASYASSITSSLGSKVGTSSAQTLSTASNAMTISGSVITLARGDGTTDTVTLPASGNTIIGTDSDINTSGATIVDSLTMTDGVITAHGTRTLTASDIGAASTSHTHNDIYYTESEMQTYFNRGYISKHSKSNMAVGWYTIATNTGDRALGEFQIWDTASSRHQSVLFNASHHYGTAHSNDITVTANSRYSTDVFRYIRITENGTYDGAALQVYIDNSTSNCNVAIVGGNAQSSGWVIKDWVADATDPGDVSNWSSFSEQTRVDLDYVRDGGIMTTGKIYSYNTITCTTLNGTATSAQYADLAENYVSDANYAVGTVLVFGGTQEVTISTTKEDKRIAGVVSTNPAYLMNSECKGEYTIPIALQGRVPCRVIGVVEKGDIIVSSDVSGAGVVWNEDYNPKTGSVIGKALVNKNTNEEEVIEVVVGVR